jgi:hypothetical protein
MKRCIEALVMLEMVAVIVGMAIVGLCGIARAEPVQQFTIHVATPRPGDVGVDLELRFFDTTGAVPPSPTARTLRLPRGFSLDRRFLDPRWLCDGRALRAALDARPSAEPFVRRVADLKPFIRELARSRDRADRAALANARACERGRLGAATGVIDARRALPVLQDPIPFGVSVFLGRGTIPGAIASITALAAAEPGSAVVRKYPVVEGVHAVEIDNFVFDPTPDGVYGDAVVFRTGPINGFDVSIAELHAHLRGLRMRARTCVRSDHSGRCTRRLRAGVQLFRLPACPSSGRLSAELFTAFAPPPASLATTVSEPCPRYLP